MQIAEGSSFQIINILSNYVVSKVISVPKKLDRCYSIKKFQSIESVMIDNEPNPNIKIINNKSMPR